MSQLLEPFHMHSGAVSVLMLFVVTFIAAVAWSLRKSQSAVQSHLSRLPLEEEK